jgi:hydroxyacylglutathione hydrolase
MLSMLPADTRLWTAHCCRAHEKTSAPWLSVQDLKDLDHALADIESGRARSTGFYPRRFAVNGQMTIATGFGWNNR